MGSGRTARLGVVAGFSAWGDTAPAADAFAPGSNRGSYPAGRSGHRRTNRDRNPSDCRADDRQPCHSNPGANAAIWCCDNGPHSHIYQIVWRLGHTGSTCAYLANANWHSATVAGCYADVASGYSYAEAKHTDGHAGADHSYADAS